MKTNVDHQRGNALVETVVLMSVMLPLAFLISNLGNVIDLNQTAAQAARYSTWETTVATGNGDDTKVKAELPRRFFGASAVPISSVNNVDTRNRLWGKTNISSGVFQQQSSFSVDPKTVAVNIHKVDDASSVGLKLGKRFGQAGNALKSVSGNDWNLSENGLRQSSIGVEISAGFLRGVNSECSDDESSTCFSVSGVILSDGWSVGNDEQVVRHVRSLMPASVLTPVGNAVSVMGNLPLFGELKGLKGAFGHVNTQVLPAYLSQ